MPKTESVQPKPQSSRKIIRNPSVLTNIYDYEENLNNQVMEIMDKRIKKYKDHLSGKKIKSHIRHNSVMEVRKNPPLEPI